MSICVYTPAVFLGQTFLVRMGFLRPLHLLSGTFLIFSGCFGSRLDSIRLIHPLKIKKRPKTKENRNLQTAGGVQAVLGVVQSAVLQSVFLPNRTQFLISCGVSIAAVFFGCDLLFCRPTFLTPNFSMLRSRRASISYRYASQQRAVTTTHIVPMPRGVPPPTHTHPTATHTPPVALETYFTWVLLLLSAFRRQYCVINSKMFIHITIFIIIFPNEMRDTKQHV